jgi:YD repeat-containing protein
MADQMKKILAVLALIVLAGPCLLQSTAAQQGGTTTFLYDKNGRLHRVILPNGEGTGYDYDPAGNITSIQRFPAGTFLVQISPTTALVNEGGSVQFSAVIPQGLGSTEITWSVNGEVGGNSSVGTISPTGLYTAPYFFDFAFAARVRAASKAAPNLFAEATVHMTDANSNPGLVSPVVTVGRSTTGSPQAAAASLTAPSISAITPNRLNHQSAIHLALRGAKLKGATGLRFIDARGVPDPSITVINLKVNSTGTLLTAVVKTSTGTALGRRVVVVVKANASSAAQVVGANTVEVVAR